MARTPRVAAVALPLVSFVMFQVSCGNRQDAQAPSNTTSSNLLTLRLHLESGGRDSIIAAVSFIARSGGPPFPAQDLTELKEWNAVARDRLRWLEKQNDVRLKELNIGYRRYWLYRSPTPRVEPKADY